MKRLETVRTLPANGMSMFPFVLPGSRLTVSKADPLIIKKGDIICYPVVEERMAAHRVVDIRYRNGRQFFLVKGDSNIAGEEIPSFALAYIVKKVEHRLFSYDTNGFVGTVFAKLATAVNTQSTSSRFVLRAAVFLWKKSISFKRVLIK